MSIETIDNINLPRVDKRVKFATHNFYNILDNLYLSDQIPSFDEELIGSKNIHYLFNFTKTAPFLFGSTSNYHIKFMNNLDMYSNESLVQKIDNTVQRIFKILLNKKGVLVYCEDGCNKSLMIIICFLLKYYNSNEILCLDDALHFIEWKTGKTNLENNNYFYLVKIYRQFLVNQIIDRNYSSESSNSSNSSNSSSSSSSSSSSLKKSKIVGIIRNHFNKQL
jgi:hypothetical protein